VLLNRFSPIEHEPILAQVHTNPVMLSILEALLGGGGNGVRAAHPPTTRITMPQDGSLGPGGGWHWGEHICS
jgi:hypothetical protein